MRNTDPYREARRRSAAYAPPDWMKKGAYADYHSVIGREITKPHLLITCDPYRSESGTWVVFLRGHSGYVCCEALTWPASDPAGSPAARP